MISTIMEKLFPKKLSANKKRELELRLLINLDYDIKTIQLYNKVITLQNKAKIIEELQKDNKQEVIQVEELNGNIVLFSVNNVGEIMIKEV